MAEITEKITVQPQLKRKIFQLPSFEVQFREMRSEYLGFLFKPRAKPDEKLQERDFLLNRYASKRMFVRKLNNPLTKLGIFIIIMILTWAVFAPWIVKIPFENVFGVNLDIGSYTAPAPGHPLGTSKYGRDVYGRLIWGARASLTMGLFSIIISSVLGVMLGIFSAYQGGWVDNVIMRIMDIIMAFPGLIMVIIIISALGQTMEIILTTYGLLGIPGYARLLRGTVLQEKTKTYVEAAKVSGSKSGRIMFKHILPNVFAPIIVSVTFDIGGIILGLAGLSFLGFSDPSLIEWGTDINLAREKIVKAPWAGIWPGVGILITVLGFMLLGDGLRDALDPRLQEKH